MALSKKGVKWDVIEVEYRAGQLAIREIARQHNISNPAIIKRAKTRGWTRDLTEQIKQRVKAKMVNDGLAVSNALTDEDIIEKAADRNIKVIELHRKDISDLQEIETTLKAELAANHKLAIVYKGEVTGQLPMTVLDKSRTVDNLSKIMHRRITLDRQARNIDDKTPTGSESDPIHVKHSMDTSGLSKAVEVPKPCGVPQLEEG